MSRLIALGLFSVAVLAHLWMLRPLDDGDLFTHIVVGRLLPGSPPLTEMETESGSSVSWLAYLVFARIDSIFAPLGRSLAGVKAFNTALLMGTFFSLWMWILNVLKRNPHGKPSGATLGAGLLSAWLVSATNVSARPQIFAYLSFSLLLLSLEVWSGRAKGWGVRSAALFALLVVWQNLHPSVVMALPVVAAYVLFLRVPVYLLLLPCIAVVCTPLGSSIFSVSARNLELSRNLLKISEWMPPWDPSVRGAMEGFWIVAVTLLLGALLPRVRGGWRDPITGSLSVLFFVLTLSSSRFGAFWGFVSAPLLSLMVGELLPVSIKRSALNRVSTPSFCAMASLLLLLLPFNPGETVSSQAPINLFSELKSAYPRARIFNYREFGGALEYVGYPDWRVFIDGRLYLFEDTTWATYHSAALGSDSALIERLIGKHDLFILHSSYHGSLIPVLERHPMLKVVAERGGIVVFARGG